MCAQSSLTVVLFGVVGSNMRDLLAQDGIKGWRAFSGTLRYVFVKPGVARQVAGAYFSYFKPGFHPWDHDDRALIENAGCIVWPLCRSQTWRRIG